MYKNKKNVKILLISIILLFISIVFGNVALCAKLPGDDKVNDGGSFWLSKGGSNAFYWYAPFPPASNSDENWSYCINHDKHTYKYLNPKREYEVYRTKNMTAYTRAALEKAFTKSAKSKGGQGYVQSVVWYLNSKRTKNLEKSGYDYNVLSTSTSSYDGKFVSEDNIKNFLKGIHISTSEANNKKYAVDIVSAEVKEDNPRINIVQDGTIYDRYGNEVNEADKDNYKYEFYQINVKLNISGFEEVEVEIYPAYDGKKIPGSSPYNIYRRNTSGTNDDGVNDGSSTTKNTSGADKTRAFFIDVDDVDLNTTNGFYFKVKGEESKTSYKKGGTLYFYRSVNYPKKMQPLLRFAWDDSSTTNEVKDEDSIYVDIKNRKPEIIAIKYIKQIKDENGHIKYESSDSWNPSEWPRENDKPIVEVNTNADVDGGEGVRYNIIPQDTKNLNITYGDIITYVFRIYNVGNDSANLQEDDLSSTNNQILIDNVLYDYPDDNLEYYPDQFWQYYPNKTYGWEEENDEEGIRKYSLDISDWYGEDTNPNHIIQPYHDGVQKTESWSRWAKITFKVTGKEAAKTTVKNNDTELKRDDRVIKFLKSVNGVSLNAPEVSVNENIGLGEDGRFTYNINCDPTIMDGDTLVYTIRYYSIGDLSTYLDYDISDTYGEGLIYLGITGATATGVSQGESGQKTFTINAPKKFLWGLHTSEYEKNTPNSDRTGIDNGIEYYDVDVTFKAKIDSPEKIAYVYNTVGDYTARAATGYEIKGKVFEDRKNYQNGKTTTDRNGKYDSDGTEPDILIQGIKVELIDASTGNVVTDENGDKYIKDPSTGLRYPTEVETDENGEFTFTHLRSREITIDSKGEITGNIDVSHPYYIRFTYNGQVYENIHYNTSGNYINTDSLSTESNSDRTAFNSKFATINSSNSADVSLMDGSRTGYTYTGEEDSNQIIKFGINAYSGNNGKGSEGGTITVDTPYKEWVNLGLVKREFGLYLLNQLDSMEVHINNTTSVLNGYNRTIRAALVNPDLSIDDLKELTKQKYNEQQEVKFQDPDYSYQEPSPTPTDSNYLENTKELKIKVNYSVIIRNDSPDKFVGILNAINIHYDKRFADKEKEVTLDGNPCTITTNPGSGYGDFTSSTVTIPGGRKIKNTADDEAKLVISFWLTRSEIAELIEANEKAANGTGEFQSLEMIAEIESYGSEYEYDIFNNGHIGNAGTVDNDSNAGNFNLKYYVDELKTNEEKFDEYFNNEDDCRVAPKIILRRDNNLRTLTGRVFEDGTSVTDNIRLGDGTYSGGEKNLEGVSVELIDTTDMSTPKLNTQENVIKAITSITGLFTYNSETKYNYIYDSNPKDVIYKTTTDSNGYYKLSGFIPSESYIVQFTYGNGTTYYTDTKGNKIYYSAQDYKSTIDMVGRSSTTDANKYSYPVLKNTSKKNENTGEYNKYGWYAEDIIINNNYSVAKDNETKMDLTNYANRTDSGEKSLTYNTAKTLEDSEHVYGNIAETKGMYVGLRWKGNDNLDDKDESLEYDIKNINLGLAERPRSELTLVKEVDHVTVTSTADSTIIDGTQNTKVDNVSWTERYVQPIIDENLIFGSKLTVTYRMYIENTGEKDYMPNNSRDFYDYGIKLNDDLIVKNTPNQVLDFVDNNLDYKPDRRWYLSDNKDNINSKLWNTVEKTNGDYDTLLDTETRTYRSSLNTMLSANDVNNLIGKSLKPGETTKNEDNDYVYLTLEKVLSSANNEDATQYNNYAEIIESTNEAGRRNYRVVNVGNYTSTDPEKERNKNQDNKYTFINLTNKLLSDVDANIRGDITKKQSGNNNYLILSVPGNIGNPNDSEKTTLGWEPDSAKAQEIQIITPFGEDKQTIIIWTTIGILSAVILAGGIYLIKRYAIK